MIHVLIIDDHALFAEGMKSMFTPEDGIAITQHTSSGYEALSILANTPFDLILLDIGMPVIDGIATLELLRGKGISVPVLMLTMHDSMKQIKGALEKGAQGYILKDANKADLIEAIVATSQHKNYFHPRINEQIFEYLRGKKASNSLTSTLSEREIEILRHIAAGSTSKEIADELFLSEHTVKAHRKNIMHKLDVKTSAELIKIAVERGFL